VGRDRYAAATAALRGRRPAYDAYDKGRAALEQGKTADAERFAREAVRLLPAEAQFHALLGDVALAGKQYDEAARRYADAVMRNDAFFYYHLQKGHAHRLLSQWEPARAEFERSVQLLPTADAYYGLGVVAEQRGDRAGALENYSRAAQSEGAAGQAARQATVRLDLPVSPSRYLAVRGTLDGNGRLVLELTNSSSVPVADVLVTVRYTDSQGASRSESQRLSGPIPPGQTLRQATGIGPLAEALGLEVTIASARVTDGA
jgi:tetratricopeptide (TPR) repeat protein